MKCSEFEEMHENCITALRAYFNQAQKTLEMMSTCTSGPLSLAQRCEILRQGLAENEAYTVYIGTRNLLLSAARTGYGSQGDLPVPLPISKL
jgi:hypothetical protein